MASSLDTLVAYADKVLAQYRDPYHGTPLFYDGFDSFSGKPVTWRNVDGTEWEPSNIASQQNLFRFLVGLSALTGQAQYADAAREAIRWHFAHADESGLLRWGGHTFLDMKTLRAVGPENKNMVHELKHHYPFYELMYEVDAPATTRLIKALWNSHIFDWDTLELSRHGDFGKPLGDEAHFWDKPQHRDLEILREAKGLSFVNIGNDLIYAAGMLSRLSGDAKPLSWAQFMAWQYVRSRYPATGLGVYQFNRPTKREEPPTDENDPRFTFSFFGDRAQRQFGPEYGDVAKEAWVLFKMDDEALNGPEGIYGDASLAQLLLARELGEAGHQLQAWTVAGLEAWARYAYVPETNEIKPMFADGKDLTGQVFQRPGYYGKRGRVFERRKITPIVFLSYATAWASSRSDALWPTVAAMAQNFGLGNWNPGDPMRPQVDLETRADSAVLLFAALEIHCATGVEAYLHLASAIGRSLLAQRWHRGTFVPSAEHIYCRFDDAEPLALAALIAAERGEPALVPGFRSEGGYIHGDALMPDGNKKNIQDILAVYPRMRETV
jgi:pectate lyase